MSRLSRLVPRRPSYAEVASTLALVLALGGTAVYAADQLPRHSVGKKQLERGAVTSAKIKNGRVKGKDLAAGTITNANLANDSVGAATIANGSIIPADLGIGSVTAAKIADNSVTGVKVANRSLSLDDLTGSDTITNLNYSVAVGTCVPLTLTIPGAMAGQAGFMTYTGGTGAGDVSISPLKITGGQAAFTVCNLDTTTATANVPVRVVTLG